MTIERRVMKKDGGAAFPREDYQTDDAPGQRGMTMRDYFAALAMQALIQKGMDNTSHRNARGVPVIAGFAYEYADAMLIERKK